MQVRTTPLSIGTAVVARDRPVGGGLGVRGADLGLPSLCEAGPACRAQADRRPDARWLGGLVRLGRRDHLAARRRPPSDRRVKIASGDERYLAKWAKAHTEEANSSPAVMVGHLIEKADRGTH
ncbi:hypothetical protein [Streptosporangium subroseum]|uniref:hypothetical protein n=1 Tax=Streptosporangium subroseum TaxID=106412 RepID=UPI003088A802|nr:hypothetical protein OHB15_03235 [Streptosporangium subroseum]